MTRGNIKAMVVVYHKGDDDPSGVHPMQYN
jgi:hypothetical protein